MSKIVLIEALRTTATRLRRGTNYQWGHFGACNCGHLAQTLTRRSRAEIHRVAVERAADWGEVAMEYCPTSGLPIDHIVTEMLAAGTSLSEIGHLEKLSDRRVLKRLPPLTFLERNNPEHVARYMDTWADLLEEGEAPTSLPLAAE